MHLSADQFNVHIIGVGNMGGGMARNLLAQGWQVHVHDLEVAKVDILRKLGAIPSIIHQYIATKIIVIIVCVVTEKQTEQVLFGPDGIAKSLPLGATVMLCPTMAPEDVERFAIALTAQGIHTIDAPMSGGPARAADGSMSLMVACAENVWVRCGPLLNALSRKLFRISEKVGDAARTKLVNNLVAGINLVGAAEGLAMAQKMGLNLAKTLDVIEQSSGQSWVGSDRMRRALAGDYAPRAHLSLLEKDTRLAVGAANSAGFTGPLGLTASRVFAAASAGGLQDWDDAALLKWLAENR